MPGDSGGDGGHTEGGTNQRRGPQGRGGCSLWMLLLGGIIALTAFLAWRFPDALGASEDRGRLVYLAALLALVSSGVIGFRWSQMGRKQISGGLRNAAIWIAIALVFALGYAFRHELGFVAQRLTGELLPHAAQQTGERELTLRQNAHGHYHVEARIYWDSIFILLSI